MITYIGGREEDTQLTYNINRYSNCGINNYMFFSLHINDTSSFFCSVHWRNSSKAHGTLKFRTIIPNKPWNIQDIGKGQVNTQHYDGKITQFRRKTKRTWRSKPWRM